MGLIEECISELVFEKTDHWDFSEITLSGKKIYVLSEINGKSSLKELCKKLNIGLSEIKNIINELGKLNLVKKIINDKPLRNIPDTEKIKENVQPGTVTDDAPITVPVATSVIHPANSASEPKKTKVYRGVSYA